MRENEIQLKDNDNFLKTTEIPYDPEQVKNAKQWYYNFTGKHYKDDIKELVEIYKILNRNH